MCVCVCTCACVTGADWPMPLVAVSPTSFSQVIKEMRARCAREEKGDGRRQVEWEWTGARWGLSRATGVSTSLRPDQRNPGRREESRQLDDTWKKFQRRDHGRPLLQRGRHTTWESGGVNVRFTPPPVKSPSLLVLHFLVNIQFAQPLLTSGVLTSRTENHKGRAANYLHVYFAFYLVYPELLRINKWKPESLLM